MLRGEFFVLLVPHRRHFEKETFMESSNHHVEPNLKELIELQREQSARLRQIMVLLACNLGVMAAFFMVALILFVAIL